jgi:L-ascorbate metabolism protein UlaG (beta-lactamase superfamily)
MCGMILYLILSKRSRCLKLFRRSKAEEISAFFAIPLSKNQLSMFYLGVSGFIIRSLNHALLIDPAGMLKGDELSALKSINLILFTHDHLDHFSSGKTQDIFIDTSAPVLAEPKVAGKLEGKIPAGKLVSAETGKSYTLGDIVVKAIQGIHRGPIMLYHIKMDDLMVFHGGDSGYVSLKDCPSNVAIVPVGRMSPTASPENAYKMVVDVKPDVALVMHGSDKQKQQFAEKVKETMPQIVVHIMAPFTAKTVSLQQVH